MSNLSDRLFKAIITDGWLISLLRSECQFYRLIKHIFCSLKLALYTNAYGLCRIMRTILFVLVIWPYRICAKITFSASTITLCYIRVAALIRGKNHSVLRLHMRMQQVVVEYAETSMHKRHRSFKYFQRETLGVYSCQTTEQLCLDVLFDVHYEQAKERCICCEIPSLRKLKSR